MSKEVREILVDLQNQYPADKWDIDNALSQIKKIIEGKKMKVNITNNEDREYFYNQAIDDVAELFEVE